MMGYNITRIEGNNIFISCDFRDQLNGFITLIKSIEGELGGRIIQLDGGDNSYKINSDPYDLTYEWDTDKEIKVIVPNANDTDKVVEILSFHCSKLNN